MQTIMKRHMLMQWYFQIHIQNQTPIILLANKVSTTGDVSISGGNLDIGPSQAQSRVKTYLNHGGSTGHVMMEGRYRDQGFLHFETDYQYGEFLS